MFFTATPESSILLINKCSVKSRRHAIRECSLSRLGSCVVWKAGERPNLLDVRMIKTTMTAAMTSEDVMRLRLKPALLVGLRQRVA